MFKTVLLTSLFVIAASATAATTKKKFSDMRSVNSEYYGKNHKGKLSCCDFNIGDAKKNLRSSKFFKKAIKATVIKIDAASSIGKKWVKVDLPYNTKVVDMVRSTLRSRDFYIIETSYEWDESSEKSTPPYIIIGFSPCKKVDRWFLGSSIRCKK